MPQYAFINEETGSVEEFFFTMKEAPKVSTVIEIEGIKWKRIFTLPRASIDTKSDPFSQKDFRDKTAKKRGTLGDVWEVSAEASAKRAEKEGGVDPVRQKFYQDYRKSRRGTPHTAELAENQKKAQKAFNDGMTKIGRELGLD